MTHEISLSAVNLFLLNNNSLLRLLPLFLLLSSPLLFLVRVSSVSSVGTHFSRLCAFFDLRDIQESIEQVVLPPPLDSNLHCS